MWKKIKDWFVRNKNDLAGGFAFGAIAVIAAALLFIIDTTLKPAPEAVTTIPQLQAETPSGVEKEPVYIIQTTGDKAQEAFEKASKQEKADFSIVTDKGRPDEAVELDKLDKNTTVNLTQYNVQAYKKHINTIEYYPAEKTVGYTHQWKISKSGKYMGIGVDYDTDDQRVMAKVTYSW